MKTKKKTCEVAIHFNAIPHQISDFQFICIEKIVDQNNLESKLITREAYWTAQLRTLRPCGLNKRQEFKSKNKTITSKLIFTNSSILFVFSYFFTFLTYRTSITVNSMMNV